jgi:hypothetical protein
MPHAEALLVTGWAITAGPRSPITFMSLPKADIIEQKSDGTSGVRFDTSERMMMQKRRDQIFEWVCAYADEMDGPTPSINEIAQHFGLNYKTAYHHVMKLIIEGRLRQEHGKLVVLGSEWIKPAQLPPRPLFDF